MQHFEINFRQLATKKTKSVELFSEYAFNIKWRENPSKNRV